MKSIRFDNVRGYIKQDKSPFFRKKVSFTYNLVWIPYNKMGYYNDKIGT